MKKTKKKSKSTAEINEYNEKLIRECNKIWEDHGFTVTKRTDEQPEDTTTYEVKFIK